MKKHRIKANVDFYKVMSKALTYYSPVKDEAGRTLHYVDPYGSKHYGMMRYQFNGGKEFDLKDLKKAVEECRSRLREYKVIK